MVLAILFQFSFVCSKKCLEPRSCQPAPAVSATTTARGTVTHSTGGGEKEEEEEGREKK
jgi:hypothetical protein